jgi:hypothetical protein
MPFDRKRNRERGKIYLISSLAPTMTCLVDPTKRVLTVILSKSEILVAARSRGLGRIGAGRAARFGLRWLKAVDEDILLGLDRR